VDGAGSIPAEFAGDVSNASAALIEFYNLGAGDEVGMNVVDNLSNTNLSGTGTSLAVWRIG
jgi:hypothetical protein